MPTNIDWNEIRRKIHEISDRHARDTGKAVTAWNMLQDTLGIIYSEISFPAKIAVSRAVWYSQESDRAQRKMLKAAAKTIYEPKAKMYIEIKWICDRADRLSEDRNNLVHVRYTAEFDQALTNAEMRPHGIGSSSRADQMSNRDVFLELKTFEENCKALADYAVNLAPNIVAPEQQPPWPERPELLKTTALQDRAQADRKRQKKSPPRQQQSSGG